MCIVWSCCRGKCSVFRSREWMPLTGLMCWSVDHAHTYHFISNFLNNWRVSLSVISGDFGMGSSRTFVLVEGQLCPVNHVLWVSDQWYMQGPDCAYHQYTRHVLCMCVKHHVSVCTYIQHITTAICNGIMQIVLCVSWGPPESGVSRQDQVNLGKPISSLTVSIIIWQMVCVCVED